ncbi:MAG: four-carbon acid sugar kinase family protein [Promicromonosporaceae bacterium]|nr:four-carbon acid sugar kinase family protein [Promicromonosporaceae bacterium]
MIELGAIADDLTGATDLALMLTSAGFRTLVTVGEHRPDPTDLVSIDAVVVALKSRTAPKGEAVRDSLAAAEWLRSVGATRLYVKYCSTFDSTPEGNIGPVVSAVVAEASAPVTVVVPSFPAAGRTVYQGHLFVEATLLERSSMRDHPLTPMQDSNVVSLLAAQTSDAVALIPLSVVRAGVEAVRTAITEQAEAATQAGRATLLVVDATQDDDLAVIAEATTDLPVLTGGSALAAHLRPTGLATRPVERTKSRRVTRPTGAPTARAAASSQIARVILSGSASTTTRRQVQSALSAGEGIQLTASEVRTKAKREKFLNRVLSVALGSGDPEGAGPLIVYTAAEASDLDNPADANLLESVFGELATRLADTGLHQLIVAGGETSGAVIGALDAVVLRMHSPLAPGVGWASATRADGSKIALALKSGNFGPDDLFTTAWATAPARP